MPLDTYRGKRDFERTPEPRGKTRPRKRTRALRFVVHEHAARRHHFDLRLELDGALESWAVPKGPSMVAGERRLAVETEPHPIEYADFEGEIPRGEYGAGEVSIWDHGTWEPNGDARRALAAGDLGFRLDGRKLQGRWHLVRLSPRASDRGRRSWLLIKSRGSAARDGRDTSRAGAARDARDANEASAAREARAKPGQREKREQRAPSRSTAASRPPPVRRAPLPAGLAPQLATLVASPPTGDDWLHELKHDGYRLLVRIEHGRAQLLTRAGHDWTERMPELARASEALDLDSALLDGEAVVLDAKGHSDFQALQRALGRPGARIHLLLFDLIHLDGYDWRDATLLDRRERLRRLLAGLPSGALLRFSDHVRGGGAEFYAEACRSGAEGIVSKRADGRYRSRRTPSWQKVKCMRRQEFVVVGFSEPAGRRAGLGALVLGAYDEEGRLQHAGRVGTGFDDATLRRLRERLEPLRRKRSAFADPPRRERDVHWVSPRLVAEVSYVGWTRGGRLRHPVFLGLREDKPAREVVIERPRPTARTKDRPTATRASSKRSAPPSPERSLRREPPPIREAVAGVRLSSPDRVYYPEEGITKSELATWYERVADRMLPLLARRPLSLFRCPRGLTGDCFFQKHADRSVPERVPRVEVGSKGKPYAMVDDLASLVALVQIGTLELHPWGARADRLDRPDLLVVDLDPDAGLGWAPVVDAARLLRLIFEELELVPFVRATGGKGLHVVVPLERRSTWAELASFARAVARELVRAAPERFTLKVSHAARAGRIYVDVLRNAREATAIATWCVRARPGAPVAIPLDWGELDPERKPALGLREIGDRLALPDPWADFESARRRLTATMRRRIGAEDDEG